MPIAFREPTRPLPLCSAARAQPGPMGSDSALDLLKPVEARSQAGATLAVLSDGSILAGGRNPSPDTYTITAHTDLAGITAIRLETMTDPSLPDDGARPGERGKLHS